MLSAMVENNIYEFDGFRLDPTKRTLSKNNELRSLRPTAFDLLLALVENHGRTVTKSEIIKRVWGADSADDRNFHVTLYAVRQSLSESAQAPHLIVRDANGYRLAVEVRSEQSTSLVRSDVETSSEASDGEHSLQGGNIKAGEADILGPAERRLFFVGACALYAALYPVAVLLEVAYEFDRFGHAALRYAPLAFFWMMFTAICSLEIDRKLTLKGYRAGLVVSCTILILAAMLLFAVLTRLLPDFPITKANIQTYPAQAAYLKDIGSFLLLAFFFLILPSHFIAVMEREARDGRPRFGLEAFEPKTPIRVPQGTIYPRFWALTLLLAGLAVASLIGSAHLLDNLLPSTHMNLFVELVYLRGILYFGLGLFCLASYYRAINRIKSNWSAANGVGT